MGNDDEIYSARDNGFFLSLESSTSNGVQGSGEDSTGYLEQHRVRAGTTIGIFFEKLKSVSRQLNNFLLIFL